MKLSTYISYTLGIALMILVFVFLLSLYVVSRPFKKWLRCRYWRDCQHYTKTSFTCENGGGPYCGVWRTFQLEEKA